MPNESAPDYSSIVREMKKIHGVRVHRWRRAMTGCAWRVCFADGRSINWIEAPRPKTPMSLAIFLHEVGHHAVGFETYRLRCEEEYHVWLWALNKMQEVGVAANAAVQQRFERSMRYAVGKAMRRRLRELPEVLRRFA